MGYDGDHEPTASHRPHRKRGVDMTRPEAHILDAIEDGDMILAEALVRSHVDALRRKMPQPQAAVLGCTHYPLLEAAFQQALGPDVAVLSQPALVAGSLAHYLSRHREMAGQGGGVDYVTTGDPARVSDRATQFLRRPVRFAAA
jgi:glutamate racemase